MKHSRIDLRTYYEAVAPVLVPYLRDRPFTMKRHYRGSRSPFVWVKDAPPELPSWIRVCPQPAKSRGGALVRYPLVNSKRALLWIVDYGCVDMHVWLSRCDRPDRADHALVDLDPKGGSFADVVRAALAVKEVLGRARRVTRPSCVHDAGRARARRPARRPGRAAPARAPAAPPLAQRSARLRFVKSSATSAVARRAAATGPTPSLRAAR